MTTETKSKLASGRITINVHTMSGDEEGFELSTRELKNSRGLYFVANGATKLEAARALAEQISDETGRTVTAGDFNIVFEDAASVSRRDGKEVVWESGSGFEYILKSIVVSASQFEVFGFEGYIGSYSTFDEAMRRLNEPSTNYDHYSTPDGV